MSVNKVILIGNLGRDPEIRQTKAGDSVASFSLAVTERWSDNERTEWVNCVAFKRLAEICAQYLKKGSKIYVEGRLETQSWEANGEKKYKTQVVLREMQMLDSKPRRQESRDDDIPF